MIRQCPLFGVVPEHHRVFCHEEPSKPFPFHPTSGPKYKEPIARTYGLVDYVGQPKIRLSKENSDKGFLSMQFVVFSATHTICKGPPLHRGPEVSKVSHPLIATPVRALAKKLLNHVRKNVGCFLFICEKIYTILRYDEGPLQLQSCVYKKIRIPYNASNYLIILM